jgi:regulator of protease activity HflC (stomatin/prohibitin superfamily)
MMVSQAIAKGDVQAINYFVADKYTQALKAMATSPNQKLLMLPLDAMGLMGSLAGIAEIAKDSFAQQKQQVARPAPPRGEG